MSSTPFFVLNDTFLDDVDDSFQARSSRRSRSTGGTSLREAANVQPSEWLTPTTNVASILNECPDILDRVPVSHRELQPIQRTSMDPCLRPFTMHSTAEYEEDSVFTSPAFFLSAHAMPRSSEHDHSPPSCDVDAGFPWANRHCLVEEIWGVQLDAPNPRAFEGPIGKEANVVHHNVCLPSSQPWEPPAVGLSQRPVFNSPRMVQSTRSTSSTISMPVLHDAGEGALHSEEMSKAKAKGNMGKRQRAWAKMQEKKVRERLADCPPEFVEEFFSKEMTEDELRKCFMAALEHCNGEELQTMAARVGTGLLLRERVVKATLKRDKWVEDGWKQLEARTADARLPCCDATG